jgi:dihydrolipoamide dehydrogenase
VIDVRVPDIGDFADVPVIEILVAVGDEVAPEDPLVTLESDKATMDIPAPVAGVVGELLVGIGDTVSEGTPILRLEPSSGDGSAPAAPAAPSAAPDRAGDRHAEVVVIGAGPGGYTAAFRAADLGLDTILVERYPTLGGVCLNVGCIPSKALLHVARVLADAAEAEAFGVRFGAPQIDLAGVVSWKEGVVAKLTGGLAGLAKQRDVEVVTGRASFAGPNLLEIDAGGEQTTISFDHCIIATGSTAATLPGLPEDPRIIDSTAALEPEEVPQRLLVIGGGIIGLEMATVYDALGSRVTVVELLDQLIPMADPDLVRVLQRRIAGRYESIQTGVRVSAVEATGEGLTVSFAGEQAPQPQTFDRILVAVGRRPTGGELALDAAGVAVDERGFIPVDAQMRTNVEHIFAIGDVAGEPLLAHKASHEGKVAAEVIAGQGTAFDARAIPAVAYTDPEIAWAGLTEAQAKAEGVDYETASFPWAASGRALTLGRTDGLTKVIIERATRRLLGVGIVGVNAGELIAEAVHALEQGADVEDVALTIHPHPTLTETLGFAAEAAAGTITDLYLPRKAAAVPASSR